MNARLLSLALVFTLFCSSASADEELLPLTPENVADNGFWIRTGLWNKSQGDSRSNQSTRRNTATSPVVYFRLGLKHSGPLHSGPLAVGYDDLQIIKNMKLVFRDGDAELLSVHLSAEVDPGNEIHLFAQFSAKKELLSKLQITFEATGYSRRRTFTVPLNQFMAK